jgi:hypothetical protein
MEFEVRLFSYSVCSVVKIVIKKLSELCGSI